MTIPPEVRQRFYALRASAAALIVFAVVAFLLRPNEFWVESLGFLAILVSVWLVRRSNEYVRRARGQVSVKWSPTERAKQIGPLSWALTGASLVACGIFYVVMYLDALHGGKEGWPAYAFGGAAVALALTTGTIAAKLFR
ncbi:MAG: hypothetical protein KGO02_17085 [Alphaproteobacteria bacterium]|jgi:hypothetical protein|nr:hypothetical protein [Alphaproteobacteria bacterium]